MQDQRKGKETMRNHLMNQNKVNQQKNKVTLNVEPDIVSQEEYDLTVQYNKNLLTLDPKFSNLKMVNGIMVRCFKILPDISEQGIMRPQPTIVSVQTASGIQSHMDVNKVGYDYKAVVVSVSDNYPSLKVGDVVIIDKNAVKPVAIGNIKEGYMQIIPKQFFYPSGQGVNVLQPKFGSDEYGYITINYSEVQAVMLNYV